MLKAQRHRRPNLVYPICLLGILGPACGQKSSESSGAKPVEYSVVSITPSGPDSPFLYKWTTTGMIESRNTLEWLIHTAYGLPEERFAEAVPPWAKRERFDVTAKVDDDEVEALSRLKPAERDILLQHVLKDRFGLRYHWVTRIFPEYALVLNKPGQVSPALTQSNPEESKRRFWNVHQRPYNVEARGVSMDDLCDLLLGTEAQLLVVDKTGLEGKYNFKLNWSRIDEPVTASEAAAGGPAPDIFAAVQQQLGLKLVPFKTPVQVMVIESVHEPTPN